MLSFIIEEATLISPLVAYALSLQKTYYEQVRQDQQYLSDENAALASSLTPNDINWLQKNTLERIEADLHYCHELNQTLTHYAGSDAGPITWSLKTNKMELILEGAKAFIADPEMFTAMIHGHFPEPFTNAPDFPIFMGPQDNAYGTSLLTYFSAALVELNLTLQGPDAAIQPEWVDSSAIAHVTPIPDFIAWDTPSSFHLSDALTPNGLVFIHSGYAFGGQRSEDRYNGDKLWGPQDCSSWVAKITGSEYAYSTLDQLFTYRLSLPENERGYIDSNWIESDLAQSMQKLYSPVVIHDPFEDILAGQVISFRKFSDENHSDAIGTGGHTGLVLGIEDNGNVLMLSYNRDMPDIEGLGIQEMHWQSTPTMEVMFFNVNQEIMI